MCHEQPFSDSAVVTCAKTDGRTHSNRYGENNILTVAIPGCDRAYSHVYIYEDVKERLNSENTFLHSVQYPLCSHFLSKHIIKIFVTISLHPVPYARFCASKNANYHTLYCNDV